MSVKSTRKTWSKAAASFKNGMLTVTMPIGTKAEKTTRKVAIMAG
jgi:HSP20 family molecular chaperone IbpA